MLNINPGRIVIRVDNQDFEILWQDQGPTQRLTVFQDGIRLGHKEVSHLTDKGPGVLTYAVRAVLKEKSGLDN